MKTLIIFSITMLLTGFSIAEVKYKDVYPPFSIYNCRLSSGYDRGLSQLKKDKDSLIRNCIKDWNYSKMGSPYEICPEDYQDALGNYEIDKQEASQLFNSMDISRATIRYSLDKNIVLPNGSDSISVNFESPSLKFALEDYIIGYNSTNPEYMKCDQNSSLKEGDSLAQYSWYGYECFFAPGVSENGNTVEKFRESQNIPKLDLQLRDFANGKKHAALTVGKTGPKNDKYIKVECDFKK